MVDNKLNTFQSPMAMARSSLLLLHLQAMSLDFGRITASDFFTFLACFIESYWPKFLVTSHCATESCGPFEESHCQMEAGVEVVSVQVVTLIQQSILMHHLYHGCSHTDDICAWHDRTLEL